MFKRVLLLLFFSISSPIFADDSWEVSVKNAPSGLFDFNVYAVTWQPTFCKLYRSFSCNCKNEFKVHGIWPYYATPYHIKSNTHIRNYHPSYCFKSKGCPALEQCAIDPTILKMIKNNENLFSLYPNNDQLFSKEWEKHGTCSGLTQIEYFEQALKYKEKIFPYLYKLVTFFNLSLPINDQEVDIAEIRAFLPQSVGLRCAQFDNRSYLYEVHFFIDRKGETFAETNTQIGEECPDKVIIPHTLI